MDNQRQVKFYRTLKQARQSVNKGTGYGDPLYEVMAQTGTTLTFILQINDNNLSSLLLLQLMHNKFALKH